MSSATDDAAPRKATPDGSSVSSYDAVPYSVGAFPQTRPDRLATIATLFGLRPAPPGRCRVLELGCAAGGNIIPMALADPASQFVGIDLSARQIEDGRATARELGLRNIDLRALSITDVPADFGQFDYVLCHGVYSWVPPAVQAKILDVCSKHLAPQGVAYVSYNCYPGWHARGAIREMLWYHTEQYADPAVRVRAARGLLAFLAKAAPGVTAEGGYGALIRHELALLLMTPDTYLLHEHLEEFNEPLYFHQFAGRAAGHGLQYLGEAQISAMVAGRFGPEVEQTLRAISSDLLHMEQYMDFLRNRMFRQTLLCHADLKPDYALRAESVSQFYVSSAAKPVSESPNLAAADRAEQFAHPGAPTLTTRDPLMKAAMVVLAERSPLPVHFAKLVEEARGRLGGVGAGGVGVSDEGVRQLAGRLLNCYTSNLVEFTLSPPGFVTTVSERPVASPYARLRARRELKTTNVRLESVALTPPTALILQHLDGGHDRAALVGVLEEWLKTQPKRDPGKSGGYVDELLKTFARNAILVG